MAWLIVIGRVLLVASPIGVAMIVGYVAGLTGRRTTWLIGAACFAITLLFVASYIEIKSSVALVVAWTMWLAGSFLAAWFGHALATGFGLDKYNTSISWRNNDRQVDN